MIKKNIFNLALMLTIIFVMAAGCGNSQSSTTPDENQGNQQEGQTSQEELTIRVAHNMPDEHPIGVYFKIFVEELEKNTADTTIKITPQLYSNGILYNDTQLPDALSTGGLEIGAINVQLTDSAKAPLIQSLDYPFLFNSWEARWAAYEENFGEIIAQQFNQINTQLLGFASYGTTEWYGNQPIRVPDDVKGKKLRAMGQVSALWLQDIGGSPVTISSQELYQAMSQGVVDGFITGPSSVYDRSLYEVTKYGTSNLAVMRSEFPVLANLDWWNGLPEDVQQAILAASQTAEQAGREKMLELSKKYTQMLTESGMELIEVSDEEKQMWNESVTKRYEELIKADPKGQELIDAVNQANVEHTGSK